MKVYVLIVALIAAGCDRRGEYDSVAIAALEPKVREVLAVEDRFKEAHPNKGANAQLFLNGLRREGFGCHAWYRDSFRIDATGNVSTRTVPMVVCVRAPADITPCTEFRVAINFKTESDSDLRTLVRRLGDLSADEATFICDISPTSAETKNKIARGIRHGYVVAIE